MLLPKLMPLEAVRGLAIDIKRGEAKMALPAVKFKPKKGGHPKRHLRLSVGWAWELAKRENNV